MPLHPSSPTATSHSSTTHFDAIVVGAGFGGLRMLWELRKLGLSARVLEAGSNVGGTWYWNRYPGARTDSEAWVYCFSFDKSLQADWDWPERFPQKKDMERYFQHVADCFDMRKDIQFDTRVKSAAYDETTNTWKVGTEQAETFACTYLVSATGLLHVATDPPFKGLNTFQGEWYMTAKWPKQPVDFSGKRVAVIGTGATGVQVIPIVAKIANHLTVFQRTPNYVTPGRNHALEAPELAEIKRNYSKIWKQTEKHVYGDVSPEERHRILDAGWEAGGFRYLFETFDDLLVDERSNALASEFMRNKIRAIVKDSKTAELLCPKNHPFASKRPPMGHYYYETFNRDNVTLVDTSTNKIEEITQNGIRLHNGDEHAVDTIIFALGFDALTGALARMNVCGRDGQKLEEKWRAGPRTYLGICVDGFPNLFMISGPQSPFANIPVVIDKVVTFIGQALARTRNGACERIEPTAAAVDKWCKHCQDLLDASPIIKAGEKANSWVSGDNIPGKARGVYFYFGGAAGYFNEIKDVADRNFEGFAP